MGQSQEDAATHYFFFRSESVSFFLSFLKTLLTHEMVCKQKFVRPDRLNRLELRMESGPPLGKRRAQTTLANADSAQKETFEIDLAQAQHSYAQQEKKRPLTLQPKSAATSIEWCSYLLCELRASKSCPTSRVCTPNRSRFEQIKHKQSNETNSILR